MHMAATLALVRQLILLLLKRAYHLLLRPLILCNLISHLFLKVLLVEVVVSSVLDSHHRWPSGVHGAFMSCWRELLTHDILSFVRILLLYQ
jgi:hypothetical protein